MKTEELKNVIFSKLLENKHPTESLADIVNKVNLTVARLHGEQVDLIDLSDGPLGEISLNQAVDKLAFDLSHSPDLYKGYASKIASVIYEVAEEESRWDIRDYEAFQEVCEKISHRFLDDFIHDVKHGAE